MVPLPEQFVPDLLTPLTTDELIDCTADGYSVVMGADPSPQCLAVLVAQMCLETGNGQKLHRYNVGNVKWSPDWDGLWTQFRCSEVISGKVVWFDPPNIATTFRAFATGPQGCGKQVEFLATRDRYKFAWHQIQQGKADAAVRELAKAGYFTANVDAYARTVVLIYGHILEPCANLLDDRAHGIDDQLRQRVTDLVLESLYDPALRDLRLGEDLAA